MIKRGASFVAELIAKPALPGEVEHAGLVLRSPEIGRITSVSPFAGQADAAGKALTGQGFPASNRFCANGSARIDWTGRNQAFLIGADPLGLDTIAALTDQSDGRACLALSGGTAAVCLMRLNPLDLRAMQPGEAARAPLGHMQSVIMRVETGFELLVWRSMAKSAWQKVETAMKSLAACEASGC